MLALVVVLLCCVVVLGVLVAGLLRSHADILRALHELGAGVGDPAADRHRAPRTTSVPLTVGPPLAGERHSTEAYDLAGVTPSGDALAIAVRSGGGLTLLAFLSSGCATCVGIWGALRDTEAAGLPTDVRVVVVTKGPDHEISAEVAAKAPPGVLVLMSNEAWSDYEVPASPFFALVDAATGRRVGEGVAPTLERVADLVRRANAEVRATGPSASTGPAPLAVHLDGPAREAENDRVLRTAGVRPGDRSLYPRQLDDVFARATLSDATTTRGASPVGERSGDGTAERP